jgi:hypothetical protein
MLLLEVTQMVSITAAQYASQMCDTLQYTGDYRSLQGNMMQTTAAPAAVLVY